MTLAPLIVDEFTGQPPGKRLLGYLLERRAQNARFVGLYCAYAPAEIVRALGLVPVSLCAFSQATIATAESVLPANLCPLIKSSYGFIASDTCPYFTLSDVVVGETTCDGKKKMFELIADRKPLHVMDLPQMPDEPEAVEHWAVAIRKLQRFLEQRFDRRVTDAQIETAIRDTGIKARRMNEVFSWAALEPPVTGWSELYALLYMAQSASGAEMEPLFDRVIEGLEKRRRDGAFYGSPGARRIMVTGCPIGGDAEKVFTIIEESGGVIVALEACSGLKQYMRTPQEGTGDPVRALARRYLRIPCSCMTPNTQRIADIDAMIERFRPDAVVDVVLQACHSYNIESARVAAHVQKKHGLPFLKIVTDYSRNDVGQLRTRVEALLEMCRS